MAKSSTPSRRLRFPSDSSRALFLLDVADGWEGGDLPPVDELPNGTVDVSSAVLYEIAVTEYGAFEVRV